MDAVHTAQELGVTEDAVELFRSSDAIDLHIESFVWHRVFGYDLNRPHRGGVFGRSFFGHADFPTAREIGLAGATWVISTNPLRSAGGRRRAFEKNLRGLRSMLANAPGITHVRTAEEFRAARAAGDHAAFIGIQGGNALDDGIDALDLIADGSVLRVTLLHLTSSRLGTSSAPGSSRAGGLTDFGRAYVERLNELRVGVDLAHVSRKGFFDAVEVHDRSQPLFVTHTGLAGVYEHWRNITDEQLRAVADTGGTAGVMLQASFLGRRGVTVGTVVDHLAHIVDTVGEDHASIGTDFDGAITPPKDLPGLWAFPRLVQEMLDRGWSDLRIRKILGGNALRVIEALRG
ncbi:MAG: membrane dipeptidase [Deltaproteobacteria bacterium]|nr:membrane dipeptidase [Deltaproteobacteria bacterium]